MERIELKRPAGPVRWLRILGLYRRAFPPAERKPFGRIVDMYRRGKADVWCVEWQGRFAGFATTVNGGELVLLDYFAMEPGLRGRGIGSAAMAAMQRLYADRGFFAEIESTLEPDPAREKRKRFYLAAGMEPLGVYARIFGVRMELLGSRCALDFAGYRAFYRDHYSPRAAEHLEPDGGSE